MNGKVWLGILPVVLLLSLAACSNVNATVDPNNPVTVNISAFDYGYESSQTTFLVGQPYHFVVTNDGEDPHEIMLGRPIQPGEMDMEEMDELAMAHIEEDDLLAGDVATMDYTFTEPAPAGTLEFSCHLPDHYEQGMKLSITVK